jgi:site-specific DNA recombinase
MQGADKKAPVEATKRAVLYARVSGDDRGKDGRNLAGQLEMCRNHAEKQSWRVVAELAEDDRGASGASFELPELRRALEMAQSGGFDILVVRELDRLSRKLAKQLVVEEELKRHGVQIEYALGDYPDTPEGNLMKNVRAVIADYERVKIAERVKRGRRLKVKAGHVLVHGRPPYGYHLGERDGKASLVIYEQEAKVVRLIFRWYTEGNGEDGPLSVRGIAQQLSEMRVPTYADTDRPGRPEKKRERFQWHRGSIQRMLKSETYAGVWYYGKKRRNDQQETIWNPEDHWLAVEVPPIISRDVWEATQERLVQNKINSRRNRKYDYLMSGRVTCGLCNLKMTGKSRRCKDYVYLYYRCPASCNPHDYAHECHLPGFRADHVDAAVWEWIESLLMDPETLRLGLEQCQQDQHQASAPLRERLEVIDDLLTDNRQQLERLLDLYLSGEFPKDVLTDRKARLEDTISALDEERISLHLYLKDNTFTEEQMQTLETMVTEVRVRLEIVGADFEMRRRITEALDMQVKLAAEDGEKTIHARCVLGKKVLSLVSHTTHGGIRHRPGDL